MAALANIGEKQAMFEAVHGTAPDIAGKGIANPTRLLRASVMMLEHLSLGKEADKLNSAIVKALKNRRTRIPPTLEGKATETFVKEILKILKRCP